MARLRFERRLLLSSALIAAGGAGCAEIAGLRYIDEQGAGGGSFSGPGYTCQWALSFGDAETTLGGIAADGDGTLWLAGGFKGDIAVAGGAPLTAGGAGTDVFVAHLARDGNHLFSERFGNAANDAATRAHQATAIAVGEIGVYVAGDFTGSLSFGADCPLPAHAGGGALFVAKLDRRDPGGHAACATHGENGRDTARAVAVDGDRVVVLTSLQGGARMGLSSFDGQTLTRPCHGAFPGLDGGRLSPRGLRVSAGEAFVIAEFQGRIELGFSSPRDALPPGGAPAMGVDSFLASFPAAWICDGSSDGGGRLRHRHYSSLPGDQRASAVALRDGGVVLGGSFDGEIDVSGEPGGRLVSSGGDGFLAHLDGEGGLRWARQLGGAADQSVAFVEADSAGDVVVAGHFQERMTVGDGAELAGAADEDIYLARLGGEDGAIAWLGGLGGPEGQRLQALAVSGTDLFLAGRSDADFELLNCPVEAGGGQLFVAKLSISSR
ncbi:hypothetical protein SOCEGT47_045270 [Sorangium cellulosum]|uniref:Uncharacterized protein n=1 Tax=Sorangium cellulosum TaxID=56 RepID=A0A4P2Q4N4_SORCE|nr:hypothetical protein [Sorangium cellulosum]AUX23996.1 hypothetical protein SOCEGT47_045270 [Sorangium cellulosum]